MLAAAGREAVMALMSDASERVEGVTQIASYLSAMTSSNSISLLLPGGRALPAIVDHVTQDESFRLDVTDSWDALPDELIGLSISMEGWGRQGRVRTAPLAVTQFGADGDRRYCEFSLPTYIDVFQQRSAFRATLRQDMRALVLLRRQGNHKPVLAKGVLRDLSEGGCFGEFGGECALLLEKGRDILALELLFPSGTSLSVLAAPVRRVIGESQVSAGFHFVNVPQPRQRRLWRLVVEIERESSRSASSGIEDWGGSSLFVSAGGDYDKAWVPPYRHAMARRLAPTVAFLTMQMALLREGKPIDSSRLSQHAGVLVGLLQQNRDAVLFALSCLHRAPPLLQHCLTVALRLGDMAISLKMPANVCKALVGAGMVHDLGKAMLSAKVADTYLVDAAGDAKMQRHVELVLQRVVDCHWLPAAVTDAVIHAINERLDGSGYPQQLKADKLPALARLAALVKVMDMLSRDRLGADAALSLDQVRHYVEERPAQFDNDWLKRYLAHFGRWPVGTLVKFANGQLAWVLSLTDTGALARIRLVDSAGHADEAKANDIDGYDMQQLGEPVESLPL